MKKVKAVLIGVTALIMACMFGFTACDTGGGIDNGGQGSGNAGEENGHKHSYSQTVVAPDCTEQGYTEYKCECGDSYKDNYVDAKGHTEVTDAGVEATCTTDGKTEGKHCSVCNEVIVAQTVIPKSHKTNGNNICEICGNDVSTAGLSYSEFDTYCSVAGIGDATDTEIYIASTYNGKPVTQINDGSFYNCQTITRLVIPDSVTQIGTSAFMNCGKLASVIIGNSVTTIGDSSFGNCTGLTNVVMGSSVQNIKASAFAQTAITNITIPDTITNMGRLIFQGCDNLQYNVYGDANYLGNPENPYLALIETIDDVKGCTVHEDTKVIAGNAFNGRSITSITIPDSVIGIGEYAFYACTKLMSLTLGKSVANIGASAFFSCIKLVEIYNLSELVIKKGTTGNGYVGAYVQDVYTSASEKSKFTTTQDGYVFYEIEGKNFLVDYNKQTYELVLPDSFDGKSYEIYKQAFYFNYDIISVIIPSAVTKIGDSAFYGCSKLIEVCNLSELDITAGSKDNGYVGYYAQHVCTSESEKIQIAVDQDGYITYEIDDKRYLVGYTGQTAELVLPDNFNGKSYIIYRYAFYNNSTITSVTVPSTVTEIEIFAFMLCANLKSVTINGSVMLISNSLFYGCVNLTSVTLPDTVTEIGYNTFYSCKKLTDINFNGTKEQWKAVTKQETWCVGTGEFSVRCTDGILTKSESY